MMTLVLPHIGGGRATPQDLERIEEQPSATAITISGLDQPTFELFVSKYAWRFRGIHFWKCPRITDLSPLQDLSQLTHVAYYWNQRVTRLWDLAATPNLRGLHFQDFTRLTALDDLSRGSSLEELHFGDAIWDTSSYATLDPLEGLPRLRRLDFSAKRLEDGRIEPLAGLPALETLKCPLRLFTTEQCAWLRAHLPASVHGAILQPTDRLEKPLVNDRDCFVIGKGKPFLRSSVDAARIARYESDFWKLVDAFRDDPSRQPAPTPIRARHGRPSPALREK